MDFQFVAAEEWDIPVIFAQAKELIDTYEDVDSIEYDEVLAWVRRKIADKISEYRCVIVDETRCAWFRLCDDGELDDLYVLPGFQCRGIGSAILEDCVKKSKNPLYLYVFSRNIRAIRLYERFGFTLREYVGKSRLIMERKG